MMHDKSGVFALLALLVGCAAADSRGLADCHYERDGCPPDSGDEVWDGLARSRGFPVNPGGDFFAYAQSGCILDLVDPPQSLMELGQRTEFVLFGRILDVTVRARTSARTDTAEYRVFLVLEVVQGVKGETGGRVLVEETCAHGGAKVAGLRRTIPDEEFLFFLGSPASQSGGDESFGLNLSWYYYGVVRQNPLGAEFAYRSEETDGLLQGYRALEEVAEAVSRLETPE